MPIDGHHTTNGPAISISQTSKRDRGHSRSLKVVPFESLGAVCYSPSIVTMAVSVAVCELFSVKEWCDLENRVRIRSKSFEMAPFDRSHAFSFP